MCENIRVNSFPKDNKAEILYLDLVNLIYSRDIDKNLVSLIGEEQAFALYKDEIKQDISQFIYKYVEEAINFKDFSREFNCIRGQINIPYYNEAILAAEMKNQYEPKIQDLITIKDKYNSKISEYKTKIQKFNSLPWYKRLWSNIE